MKNEVIVEGVKLTRVQVEKALQELNTPEPEPEPFEPGDIVTGDFSKSKLVVLGGVINSWAHRQYGTTPGYVRATDGRSTYNYPASFFTKVGTLSGE